MQKLQVCYNIPQRIRLIFFLLLFSNFSFAQLVDSNRVIIEDGWIEKMNRNFGFKLSFDNNYETFKVIGQPNDIILYPNINTNLNLIFSYRFILLKIGFAPDFLPGNGDEDIKGETQTLIISSSFVFKRWFQHLSFRWVEGFYLRNTDDYVPGWSRGDPYIQFPELAYTGFSGTTSYFFNPRFSIRSFTTETERQLKSTGSFIAFLNYRYYIMDNKSIPTQGGSTQKSNNLDINIGPGYYYTFVFREKFYIALGFRPSIGYLNTRLTTRYPSGDEVSYQDNFTFRWHVVGGFGYNIRKFFTGFYVSASGMRYNQQNTTAVNFDTRAFFELFVGFRIKASDRLNGFFDRLGL